MICFDPWYTHFTAYVNDFGLKHINLINVRIISTNYKI